jgi:hypothetical protein
MMAAFKNMFGKFYGTNRLVKMGWNSYLSSMFKTNKPFDDTVEICWHCGVMASFKTIFDVISNTSDPHRAGELLGSSVDRLWNEYRNECIVEEVEAWQLDQCKAAFAGGCWFIYMATMTMAGGEDEELFFRRMMALHKEKSDYKTELKEAKWRK